MKAENDFQLLTTGKAAELLGVVPDTVLRWIRKGRLAALHTAGGHCRIRLQDLEPLLDAEVCGRAVPPAGHNPQPLHCWEYLNPQGGIPERCGNCLVYRVRATWCFRLAQLEQEIGHARSLCSTSCEDCVYFRRVHQLATNILVISSDPELISRLAAEPSSNLSIRFARNAYDASAMIQDFRPGFVILDDDLWRDVSELVDCLASDPRVPGLRVILAVRTSRQRNAARARKGIAAVLEKPFDAGRVEAVIRGIPVEALSNSPESRKESKHAG